MLRKRKNPTPSFRIPTPFQPMSGESAQLQVGGVFPYSALVQIAAEDTETNYVLCRGFDTRINKFIDYEVGNADKPGLPVAKPYGKRKPGAYKIAQVFQALLPLQTTNPSPSNVDWRIHQNPGVAVGGQGHPQSLTEKIDELYTSDGKLVNWMLVDSGGGGDCNVIRFKIITADPDAKTASVAVQSIPPGCTIDDIPDQTSPGVVTVCDPMECMLDESAEDLVDRDGWAHYQLPIVPNICQSDPNNLVEHWEMVTLCCKPCAPLPEAASPSSAEEMPAMITGSGPGPIPGQFLP